MANILLSWINHVDAGSVAASSEAGNLAASNLLEPSVAVRWRTTDLAAHLDVDFGADVEVGVVALRFYRPMLSAVSGTIQHTIDADGGTPGAGAVYDSGPVAANVDAGYGYHMHQPSMPATGRYWRASFNLTGPALVDIGRAWAGPAFQPSLNLGYDYADFWRDPTGPEAVRARRSGRSFLDDQPSRRVFELPFTGIKPDDRASFRDLDRVTGTKRQALVCIDPETETGRSRDVLLGRFEDEKPLRLPNAALYEQVMIIVEDL